MLLSPLHDGVGDDIGVVLVDVDLGVASGELDDLVASDERREGAHTHAWGRRP